MEFALDSLESRTLLSVVGPVAPEAPVGPDSFAVVAACERAATDVVNIPDPVLRSAIRQALGKPEGDITRRAMLHLKTLTASVGPVWYTGGIRSLEGLQYATNLRELMVYNNRISDLSPISRLPQLVRLNVGRNRISDLRPLQRMTELRRVVLTDNRIIDLRPLARLVKVTFLSVGANKITNLRPLAKMTKLMHLGADANPLRTLRTLPVFRQSADLFLTETGITDLSPLLKLPNPGYIDVSYNGLDLSPGSAASLVIAELQRRGAVVEYLLQE